MWPLADHSIVFAIWIIFSSYLVSLLVSVERQTQKLPAFSIYFDDRFDEIAFTYILARMS